MYHTTRNVVPLLRNS